MTTAPSQATQPYRFIPDTHTHLLGDRAVVGVTTAAKGLLYDPSHYAKGSDDRGTRVHVAVELWDLYGEETNDLEALPYLNAWRKFRADKQFTPELVEHAACNENLGFAGVIDRVGNTPEIPAILADIKSGAKEPWHRIQTAAYVMLMPNPFKLERWCVYLRSDETYELEVHPRTDLQADLAVFLSCLTVHNWRKRNGIS
jgi:hypothetical protein